jgi:hypothetical protein
MADGLLLVSTHLDVLNVAAKMQGNLRQLRKLAKNYIKVKTAYIGFTHFAP